MLISEERFCKWRRGGKEEGVMERGRGLEQKGAKVITDNRLLRRKKNRGLTMAIFDVLIGCLYGQTSKIGNVQTMLLIPKLT